MKVCWQRWKHLHWLLFLSPREAELDSPAWYRSMADQYLRRTAWTRLRLAQVQRLVRPAAGDRVLDLGCASGAISHFCASCGARVTGVDLSAVALDFARQMCRGLDCRFVQSDVARMPDLASGSFDKAVAADLVEHLPDRILEPMLREVHRLLETGGSLSVYTPNRGHWIERLKARGILVQNISHVAVRRRDELEARLRAAGFQIELSDCVPSHLPAIGQLERLLLPLPLAGELFGYRICVRGRKAA
ncbi:MAG: methyltransferase domain-containing protein [Deltaproteobacteria bacterium]|nr:methyltransferase domain-containing protein [Deltaproteobacteria bacterium]